MHKGHYIQNMFKVLLIVVLMTAASQMRAEILKVTHEVNIIKEQVAKLKEGDLCFVDANNILFWSENRPPCPEQSAFFREKFAQIEEDFGKDEAVRLHSIFLSTDQPMIVDPAIPEIIHEAQNSGVIVLCLTKGRAGPYGVIKDSAHRRVETLKSMGIDFSKSLDLPCIDLGNGTTQSVRHADGHPIFQKGIIFTAKLSKDEILSQFLKASRLSPKKILLIDNQMHNLRAIEEKCRELGIDYTGIHFTKVEDQVCHASFDQAMAEIKFSVLRSEKRWIDDAEARHIMNQRDHILNKNN